VIPADFDYVRVSSVDEALSALRDGGEEAKLLAGGHSLIPLMKLRVAAPSVLVDIGGVRELEGIRRDASGATVIGALTRHSTVAADESLGLIAKVAKTIADQQVRNRGTIGGSIAHGDPAADLPAALLAAEGSVTVRGSGGTREIPGSELFVDYMTTAIGPDEVLTEVRIPSMDGWRSSYQKFNRRQEDWAMVAVCVMLRRAADGTCDAVRIGLTNMASTPLRASAAEELLRGRPLTAETIALAADQADNGTEPPEDLNASSDYKRHLARVLCRRALEEASAG
jgi:carbon-monoxide dehydrogenase medium subunit